MKKLIAILTLFCFSSGLTFADQILVYNSLNDYKNNTPTLMEGEIDGFPDRQVGKLVYQSGITVKTTEKKVRILASGVWGFKYKDVLFRTIKFVMKQERKNEPSFGYVALVSQGNICYWENGLAALDVLLSNKDPKKGFIEGQACNGHFALSKSIESEIHSGRFNNFFKDYPEYKAIPSEFQTMLNTNGCTGIFAKNPNMNMLNKLYDLGGTDEIAYINLWSGVNNNFGKTMGLTSAVEYILKDSKATSCIREYFKKYNDGNFEKQIEGSVYGLR